MSSSTHTSLAQSQAYSGLGGNSGKPLRLALDAMGGDDAPGIVVEGARIALSHIPTLQFTFFGNEALLSPLVSARPELKNSRIVHTLDVVSNTDKPSAALRQGRASSMGLAIKAVADGEADGAVSAGNTGALMALAKFGLRTLPGIDRPAIAGVMPNTKSESIMLDLGANVECDANNLFQFAVMGEKFAKALLGIAKPSIGILNIGSEETKGSETLKEASDLIRESGLGLDFRGYVEGTEITKGTVDVIVTDGFSGNIALKTAEGTAKMCTSFLRQAFESSLLSRIGGLLAKPALKKLFSRLDPRLHNGAMFLGLNGIVVKSHGGTDATGFAHAISVAATLISKDINANITAEMQRAATNVPSLSASSTL